MPRFVRIQNRRMATPIDLDDGIRGVRCTREIRRWSVPDKQIVYDTLRERRGTLAHPLAFNIEMLWSPR